jgi:membrane peptidoglycan carboxypeptidase
VRYRSRSRTRGHRLRRRRLGAFARFGAAVVVQLLVLGAAYGVVVGAGVGNVPEADAALATPQLDDTLVYDRTGQVLLADLHPPGYQHYQRPLAELGSLLPAASVAVEDRAFWNEPGIDPVAIARAARTDMRAHAIAGALDHMSRGDEWYTPPPGLDVRQVDGRTAYFLPGTEGAA